LFLQKWITDKNVDSEQTGIALLLEPGQAHSFADQPLKKQQD